MQYLTKEISFVLIEIYVVLHQLGRVKFGQLQQIVRRHQANDGRSKGEVVEAGHFLSSFKLVQNLVIRRRPLQCFQSWPPGRVTCIATLPWIALLALSVSIELVSSSARVNSVKSAKVPQSVS